MTCVIACSQGDGWMISDRRLTFAEVGLGPFVSPKIHRFGRHLFAAAGAPILQQSVTRAVQSEPSTLVLSTDLLLELISSVFRQYMRDPLGQGLILIGGNATSGAPSPRIVIVDIHGGLHDVDSPWWAIGSGAQAALGFLRGSTFGSREGISPEDGEHAIACAAELTANVGDGTQLERLG